MVVGFVAGIEARDLSEVTWRLGLVAEELRGFAYEGATMALTVLDRLLPCGRDRTRRLLLGPPLPAVPHPNRHRVRPGPVAPAALAGCVAALPMVGELGYFPRAVAQGIGRALWFIHGAQLPDVVAAVGRFAAAFAGGATAGQLAQLRRDAAGTPSSLAQGAEFAAKARTLAGLVPRHTAAAVVALAGVAASQVSATVDAAVAPTQTSSPGLVYQEWRAYVRQCFAHVAHAI